MNGRGDDGVELAWPADLHLTPAQVSFARGHGAVPGLQLEPGGSVYLYARMARTTHRWLVDALGRELDCSSFRDP